MDDPPPVPPKDTPSRPSMGPDRELSAPPSGSKRKREAREEHVYNLHETYHGTPDPDSHSPKRSRSRHNRSDYDASDDATPVQQRNVRRKKGVRNLSNLNLRHAAERQAQLQAESQPLPRESKFQEGSLTDKPSERPPSAFTRFFRTDSGNFQRVDELMADYHNGMPTPRGSVEIDVEREKAQIPARVAAISSQSGSAKDNDSFLYRFGRQIAASFHPVRMWKEVWDETYEELRQKNIAEINRKRALKEEAERRYAQMKASGQFEPKELSRVSVADSNVSMRDSGVIFSSGVPSFEHKRDASYGSHLAPPTNDTNSHFGSEAPEPPPSTVRTLKSRLSFKRPSLQNLRFDLKRAKSDYNLVAAANSQRDSSSSVSPVKTDTETPGLKKSHSRIDMRKQHKLSKRVSDLEGKLMIARRELDDALEQATPMPHLSKKYERFTPNSTIKRPKFVPGKLETLPSERLLDPSQLFEQEQGQDERVMDHRSNAAAELQGDAPQESQAVELMDVSEEKVEDTIKASHARPYPPRASSLFHLDNNNIESIPKDTTTGAEETTQDDIIHVDVDDDDDDDDDDDNNMDIEENITVASNAHDQLKNAATYATLDAKLKALDENVKLAAKKPTKSKKRKSGGTDLRDYRPGVDEDFDDDAEWEEAAAKRRKSGGSTKKKAAGKSATASDDTAPVAVQDFATNDAKPDEAAEDKEKASAVPSIRTSFESPGALAPLVEEDAEEGAFANRDPTKQPTADNNTNDQQATEHDLMTRAAAAARKHRSHSPAERKDSTLAEAVDGASDQTVPGTESEASTGKKRGRGRPRKSKPRVDEAFEWPEDVF